MSTPLDLSGYIEQCTKDYPHIRPLEEEDDIEWWNQGLDLIEAGKLDEAEEIFKKLLLAQPDMSDGYNGIGLVYEKRQERDKAQAFLREAVAKAERMVERGFLEGELLDVIRSDLNRISNM